MSWLGPPPDTGVPPRDELVIKVLVALRVPGVDVVELVQAHRRRLVGMMQHFTGLKADADERDVGLLLVVDAEIYRLDAVIRWLDSAEARLRHGVDLRFPSVPLSRGRAVVAAGSRSTSDGGVGVAPGFEDLWRGADVGPRPDRRRSGGPGRRAGGGDGSERIGQEHAVDDRWHVGGTDVGVGAALPVVIVTEMSRNDRAQASSSVDRLCVPSLQPAGWLDGGGERGVAAGARRHPFGGRTAGRDGGVGATGTR